MKPVQYCLFNYENSVTLSYRELLRPFRASNLSYKTFFCYRVCWIFGRAKEDGRHQSIHGEIQCFDCYYYSGVDCFAQQQRMIKVWSILILFSLETKNKKCTTVQIFCITWHVGKQKTKIFHLEIFLINVNTVAHFSQ